MGSIAFLKVLKISAFRNLWLSQAISQIFLNLLFFSLMIRIYELTHSNAAVSFVVLLTILPNIAMGALAGILVDRWERKIVMFFSHFLRVFAVLAFLASPETLGWLFFLLLLIGIITQFFFPSEAASIPEYVKDRKMLLTANSFFSLTFFSSVILGNVLAGPFLRLFGPHLTFVFIAGAFLASSFFTAQLPGEHVLRWIKGNLQGQFLRFRTFTAEEWRQGAIFSDLLVGLDHIHRTPPVRRGIYLMGIAQIMIGVLGSIAPGFADRILHVAVADTSLFIMAPAAAGMVIGALLVGQYFQKADRYLLIRGAFLSVAIILIVFSLVDRISIAFGLPILFLSLPTLILLGTANAFMDIPVNTLIQVNTPEGVRSRVYGVVSTIIGLAGIFPIILAGSLADMLGVRAVMLTAGFVLLALAVYNHFENHHAPHPS